MRPEDAREELLLLLEAFEPPPTRRLFWKVAKEIFLLSFGGSERPEEAREKFVTSDPALKDSDAIALSKENEARAPVWVVPNFGDLEGVLTMLPPKLKVVSAVRLLGWVELLMKICDLVGVCGVS